MCGSYNGEGLESSSFDCRVYKLPCQDSYTRLTERNPRDFSDELHES